MPKFLTFTNTKFLSLAASQAMEGILRAALLSNNRASILLSGGSTPKETYSALSNANLPWENVEVGLVDDRWVFETNPGSNTAMIRAQLLKNKAASARFYPLKSNEDDFVKGCDLSNTTYAGIKAPYCATVLGMGPDGHTASWFPKSEGLKEALSQKSRRIVVPIIANKTDVTGDYLERATLTLSALRQSLSFHLLITGDEKRAVFETAANDPHSDLPIAHAIRTFGSRMTVYWAP